LKDLLIYQYTSDSSENPERSKQSIAGRTGGKDFSHFW